jgi:hypothetical protein
MSERDPDSRRLGVKSLRLSYEVYNANPYSLFSCTPHDRFLLFTTSRAGNEKVEGGRPVLEGVRTRPFPGTEKKS